MFRLVLPSCDLLREIKTDDVWSDENKDKAYVRFRWTTKNGFIPSVMWWTKPPKAADDGPSVLEIGRTWTYRAACEGWEREYSVPSMNFYDTVSMSAEYLIYRGGINDYRLASGDGAFELRFKRQKARPFIVITPYANHDVEYVVTVTIAYVELPEAARELVEGNLEKKSAAEADAKRREGLKRRAEELRAMAAALEREASDS